MIYLVPPTMIDETFPKVSEYLRKAIYHQGYTTWDLPSLYAAATNRHVFLFVDDLIRPNNAMVLQFFNQKVGLVCYIAFVGGNGKLDWQKELKHVFEFARSMGAVDVTGSARMGWLRKIKHKKISVLVQLLEE